MSLTAYYRYSDKGYVKTKLPGTDKKFCFETFRNSFEDTEINLIGDNISDTEAMIEACPLQKLHKVTFTNLGNAGSLLHVLELSIKNGDGLLYFSEDDYVYHPDAMKILHEGLHIGDYVSLYDHPDKYGRFYNYGEESKVYRLPGSHWRKTISTCMTFGTRASILREDIGIWRQFLEGKEHPDDHGIFTALNDKGRKLVVCMPGRAFHTDLSSYTTAVMLGDHGLLDSWAIEMAIANLEKQFTKEFTAPVVERVSGYEKLLVLDALYRYKKAKDVAM